MMYGGLEDELYCLLQNPKWAAKKLRSGEILLFEEDYGLVLESLRRGRLENGAYMERGIAE